MTHDPARWNESSDAPAQLRDWLRGARADLPDRRRLKAMGLTPAAVAAACVSASEAASAGVVGTTNAGASAGTTAGAGVTGTAGTATTAITATGAQLLTGVGIAVVVGAIGLGSWMMADGGGTHAPREPLAVAPAEPPLAVAPAEPPLAVAPAEPSAQLERASGFDLGEHEVPAPERNADVASSRETSPSSRETSPSSRGSGVQPRERVPEAVLLRQAQQRLSTDPAQALRLLQRHEREYPRGSLIQEREVLRIQALEGLGRAAEGRALRERFERRYPDSAHRPKIEGTGDER